MLKVGTVVKVNNNNTKKSYGKITNSRIYDENFYPCVEITVSGTKFLVPSEKIIKDGKVFKMEGVL